MSAVARASVMTQSSWPVIPFLGIQTVLSSTALRSVDVTENEDIENE
jgi:uncharacterized membrane protein